jgi:hypothetical protein
MWDAVVNFNAAVTTVYDAHANQPVDIVIDALMVAVRATGATPTTDELLPLAELISEGHCPSTDLPKQKLRDGKNNDGDPIGPDVPTDR